MSYAYVTIAMAARMTDREPTDAQVADEEELAGWDAWQSEMGR